MCMPEASMISVSSPMVSLTSPMAATRSPAMATPASYTSAVNTFTSFPPLKTLSALRRPSPTSMARWLYMADLRVDWVGNAVPVLPIRAGTRQGRCSRRV